MNAAPFSISSTANWADVDVNGHMANYAYLYKCVDARMSYFQQCGFSAANFVKRRIGPVVQRDVIEYFREFGLMEPLTVTLALGGMSADGSRFRLVNEILKADGERAARIVSEGGWLDLGARKLMIPPPDLMAAMSAMSRTADYESLPSSMKS
ncbi:MAG: thioesterase family protein [Gammaproteobacteria bacterium]